VGICVSCGNDYDKSFELILASGERFVFDSFECAIRLAAVECSECHCKIIGHGMESGGLYYCCAHCAKLGGAKGLKDRTN